MCVARMRQFERKRVGERKTVKECVREYVRVRAWEKVREMRGSDRKQAEISKDDR